MTVAELVAKLSIKVDQGSLAKANSALTRLRSGLSRLTTMAAAGFVGMGGAIASVAVGLKKLTTVGDTYLGGLSKIRQMVKDPWTQERVTDKLFAGAQEVGVEFGTHAQLFQNIGKAATDMGKSFEDAVGITNTLSKAIASSGASGAGADAALQQLGQALGANRFSGQEFNSVLEQAPIVIDLIAKNLGKTRGEMRKLADSGKLTAKVILTAFEQQKGAVDAAFADRIEPVEASFVRLKNKISKSLGELMQNPKVRQGLSELVDRIGQAVDWLMKKFEQVTLFIAEHGDEVKKGLKALAVVFGVFGAAAAAAWILATWPLLLLGAAIAATVVYWDDITAAVDRFFEKHRLLKEVILQSGRVLKWLAGAVVTAIKGSFGFVWGIIKQIFDAVATVGNAILGIAESIYNAFAFVFNWISENYDATIGKIADGLDWLLGGSVAEAKANVQADESIRKIREKAAVNRAAGNTNNSTANTTNTMAVTINAPGGNPQEISKHLDGWWDRKMVGAKAGTSVK